MIPVDESDKWFSLQSNRTEEREGERERERKEREE